MDSTRIFTDRAKDRSSYPTEAIATIVEGLVKYLSKIICTFHFSLTTNT
ncbi:MAG: hypothetical protein AB4206_09880 [Xenococcaceae cyanobacterium]